MEEVLNERKQKILKAIIKTYMETGEPVGSRTISKYADLSQSATIRNEVRPDRIWAISSSLIPQQEGFLQIRATDFTSMS